jgi:hypothetical protein
LAAIRASFGSAFIPGMVYRASGVTLFGLVPISHVTRDLFSVSTSGQQPDAIQKIYSVIDEVVTRHGSRALHICSSLLSLGRKTKKEKTFSIPVLGKVS